MKIMITYLFKSCIDATALYSFKQTTLKIVKFQPLITLLYVIVILAWQCYSLNIVYAQIELKKILKINK